MAECLTARSEHGQFETEDELRGQICRTGHGMYAHGLVVACEGSISVRFDRNQILVTPADACKGHMALEDLLGTDACGGPHILPNPEVQKLIAARARSCGSCRLGRE